jgi:multiple sugar transport system ATP-binding protein
LDLYNRPENKFVASFIGSPSMNFLSATVTDINNKRATVVLPGGNRSDVGIRAATITAGPVELGVRPEHLAIVGADDPTVSLRGAIAIVERLGNSTILYVDTPAGQLIVEGDGNLAVKSGDVVGLVVDAPQAHLFGAEGATL